MRMAGNFDEVVMDLAVALHALKKIIETCTNITKTVKEVIAN